jgi:hypothetical protein
LTTVIRVVLAVGCACISTACTSAAHPATSPTADIGKVAGVRASFGPEYHVTNVRPTGIDPKVLTAQKLPEGLKFDPADCAKFATAQGVPPGVQGNMAAVVAAGDGNRFIAIAVQTSKPVPVSDPGTGCQKVSFANGPVHGLLEVVGVPQIARTRTLGVHRVVQTLIDGKSSGGEIYDYSAHFGDYQVIVTANSLLTPGKPVHPVDTVRAQQLLSTAVAAVRTS